MASHNIGAIQAMEECIALEMKLFLTLSHILTIQKEQTLLVALLGILRNGIYQRVAEPQSEEVGTIATRRFYKMTNKELIEDSRKKIQKLSLEQSKVFDKLCKQLKIEGQEDVDILLDYCYNDFTHSETALDKYYNDTEEVDS